mmetsp:Transcript_94593/g.187419  ORF Transcript_94593/g.187419 Transcript_94593/m.187419 type:complete len:228 (-) Transcript_94593:47-730(-)
MGTAFIPKRFADSLQTRKKLLCFNGSWASTSGKAVRVSDSCRPRHKGKRRKRSGNALKKSPRIRLLQTCRSKGRDHQDVTIMENQPTCLRKYKTTPQMKGGSRSISSISSGSSSRSNNNSSNKSWCGSGRKSRRNSGNTCTIRSGSSRHISLRQKAGSGLPAKCSQMWSSHQGSRVSVRHTQAHVCIQQSVTHRGLAVRVGLRPAPEESAGNRAVATIFRFRPPAHG